MTEQPKTWFGVRTWWTWTVEGYEDIHAEERILLVKADSEERAKAQAEKVCKRANDSFLNSDGETVVIKFLKVTYVFATLEERLRSGMEVFGCLYEVDSDGDISPEWPLE